ncbi:PepSY domain-containing protein, partial [Burkholderia pseudomallei]|nr:PepSY domain-containing protein [Burkholderia pseudomallei]
NSAATALAALFWSPWLGSALLAARGLMGAAGAAYLLAGAAHLSIALLEAGTPVYGHVDAALAGLGALLLRAARRGRRVATLSAGVPPPHSELL